MKTPATRIGVIPVGGKGTRLGWLGNLLPKPLVPLGQKPMLYHVIKNLKIMGIDTIYLLVNYKSNLIKQYVSTEKKFNKLKFRFIKSEQHLGLAEVILKTEKHIKESFAVILGDDFTQSTNLKNFTTSPFPDYAIAMEAIVKENRTDILSQTCEIYTNSKGQITKAVEKPTKPKSKFRGCGIYLFTPQIFGYIRKTKHSKVSKKKEITDTINLVAKDKKAYVWRLKGVNVNVNTQTDLEKATKYLYSIK